MIRNIIFDWSGTLVDDLPAVWRASNHVFRQAGLPELSLDQFRAEFCLPFKAFYDRYTPDVPMARLEEWFHAHFHEVKDLVEELPHAREFLQNCRDRGIRTFLLSAIHRDHFAAQSARTGFGAFIDRHYIEVHDKRARILEILAENGLTATETLFIGDMSHDIETAKHGGVHSCAVLTGYAMLDQLRASNPDLLVEHLGELRRLLDMHDWHLPIDSAGAPKPPSHPLPIVTVGGLIFNHQGEILMIRTRKWSNLWGIPGGKIELGETSDDALRREVKEETNLDVADIRFVMVQDCIHSREFYRDAHFVLLNYTCRVVGPDQVTLNEEAETFRWIAPADASQLPLNRPTQILLDEVKRLHQP